MEWLHNISISTALWIILGIANFPVYTLVGNTFFDSSEDFWEGFKFSIQPDWYSMISGEFFKDMWHSFKFGIFLAILGAIVTGEHTFCSYLLNEYVIEMNGATLYDLIFETT